MMRRTALLMARCGGSSPALEQLEARKLLSNAPLPSLAELSDPSHAVVRLGTEVGAIDVELFDSAATAELIGRVNAGDLDEAFFHSREGGTLRTGAFRFTDGSGLSATAGVGTAASGAGVAAAARTVAVLPSSGELIFNLADNSDEAALAEAVVIGRVVDDASWGVVQAIASMSTADLSAGLGGSFTAVPVVGGVDAGAPVSESALVEMVDIELVKFAGDDEFLSHAFYYPEGFAGSTINEFLPLANPNGEAVSYQVIARFEVGQRDMVIATGVMAAHARDGITISQFERPALNLVPQGVPYALEVRATAPVSANLSHYDFGTATGETFTKEASTLWVLADGVKGPEVFDFLVWQNVSSQDATVTVTFYPENGSAPTSMVMATAAHRRNGLSIANTEIVPEGRFSVRLESTQPIVAALTHYDPAGEGHGFTTLGATGTGSTAGVAPMATFAGTVDEVNAVLSFLYQSQVEQTFAGLFATKEIHLHQSAKIDAEAGYIANVATNSVRSSSVHVHQKAIIDGNVFIGPDGDADRVVHLHQHARITGDITTLENELSLPDVQAPNLGPSTGDALFRNRTYTIDSDMHVRKFDVSNATVWIEGDVTILVDKDFKLDCDAHIKLRPGASLTVYVRGNIEVDGNSTINTRTDTPGDVDIIALSECGIHLKGGAKVRADFLAPRAEMHMHQRAHVWGSFAGKKVHFHQDAQFTVASDGVLIDENGNEPAVISLLIDFEDPELTDMHVPNALTLAANSRGTVDLASLVGDLTPYLGKRFSVHYTSNLPVHAGMSRNEMSDGVSSATGVAAGREFLFAEGFMDPARAGIDVYESIAAYNPGVDQDATVTIRIMYTDGYACEIQRVIAGGATGYVDLHAEDMVLKEGMENRRYFYAISVTSDLPVVVQMDHLDLTLGGRSPSGGFSTLGTAIGELTPLGAGPITAA